MWGMKRALVIFIFCGLLAPSSALALESWSLQPTPNAGEASTHNHLFDVSCDSADLAACTAVGTRYNGSGGITYPVAQRWDGVSWSAQAVALKVPGPATRLFGVDCPSATRCIAVGNYDPTVGGPKTLAEIWNGGSWSIQSTPVPAEASSSELVAVGCSSTANCTAVGSAVVKGVKTAIAQKWTSPTWAVSSIPIPAGATSSQLDGVDCIWSNFCVAVGRYTTSGGITKSLAMFWNGTWSLQTLPEPVGATQSTLLDVSCTPTPNACTAVGGWKNGSEGNKQFTLAYRFNGSSWTLQSTPSPSTSIASVFQDVSCKTATSCAAVGSWVSSSGGSNQTLAEDWSGSSWTIQSTPNAPGTTFNAFFGVQCRAPGCLGVGYSTNSSGINRTLSALRSPAPRTNLTYKLIFGPSSGGEGETWKTSLRNALKVWSQWTQLTFTEISISNPTEPDLYLTWSDEYAVGQEFDGPGGKVVRAYGPLEASPGRIYFDDSEAWSTNTCCPVPGKVNITTVAENAIEHGLGISGGTSYETDVGGNTGLTMSQIEAGIGKYGSHPTQRRYFLRNSNSEGSPDIVFETPADGPDSEFAGDVDGDGYDNLGWFEQHSFLCDPPRDEELCRDQVWLYSNPHTNGSNVPYLWTTAYDEVFNQTYDFFIGDWDGDGDERVGYYEGEFTLLGDFSGIEYNFDFGNDGDIPLAGDWNGDGKDTIGMFRRSNSTFYLRNSNSAGGADIVIASYAVAEDQPVVGDWNGDGKDTIGIYRPSTGQWRLNDQNENNAPEYAFFYGNVGGWVRIVGDWNGDGKDTPGFAQD